MADSGGKHLTVVSPTFWPEPIGTPLYVASICRWFDERGWSVRVITNQPYYPEFHRHPGYGRATRRDALGDIEIHRLRTLVPRRGQRAWRALSEAVFLVQGLLLARAQQPTDAVLSVSPGSPWSVRVGAAVALRGGRHVALVHDIQSGLLGTKARGIRRLSGLNERLSLRRADVVAGLSPSMRKGLLELGIQDPMVLPLWSTVDRPDTFGPLPAEVQYSGNFGAKQGIDLLPSIARGLADHCLPLRVRGAGPRFDDIVPSLIHAAGDMVIAEPLAKESDLAPALGMSPVHIVLQARGTGAYVMPSKIVNALAVGATVVVMADAEASVSQLADETPGLHVVPTGDANGLVERVVQVMDAARAPEARRRIAEAAEAAFSRDAVLCRLERLLCGEDPVGRRARATN